VHKPLARQERLVSEQIGDELLVYDRERQTAHSLNHVAATVWNACDGTRDQQAIAHVCNLDPDTVALTLSELAAINLLDGYRAPATGISRRHMLRRAALTGAGIGLTLPVIRSVVAPGTASAFASICGGGHVQGSVGYLAGSCTSECSCSRGCCCHPPGLRTFCFSASQCSLMFPNATCQ
jgi:hypothetical protein